LLGRREGCFFAGDAIYEGQLVDNVPGSDIAAYRVTMARIRDLSVAKVYGGHNGTLTQERMKEIAEGYLDRS
jgi:glyoxylase-like metal-dependent hydrolase (beta-lactamase superfamily II)